MNMQMTIIHTWKKKYGTEQKQEQKYGCIHRLRKQLSKLGKIVD